MTPHVHVDLGAPAAERWRGLAPHRDAARALIAAYLADLGGTEARELIAAA